MTSCEVVGAAHSTDKAGSTAESTRRLWGDVGFDLPRVRYGQLGIVADGIINFSRGFPSVLRAARNVLDIILAIGGTGDDIGIRIYSRSPYLPSALPPVILGSNGKAC